MSVARSERGPDRDGVGFTLDRHAEGAEHPLRMIPRNARFPHTGAAAAPRDPPAGARTSPVRSDFETVVAAAASGRPVTVIGGRPDRSPDVGAHASQGLGDPLHGPLHQRSVADQRGLERLTRQESGEQSHRRARIAEVERAGGGVSPPRPRPGCDPDPSRSIPTPIADSARASRQSSLSRKPRISVVPCAIAPSMRRTMRDRLVAGNPQFAGDLAAGSGDEASGALRSRPQRLPPPWRRAVARSAPPCRS